MVWASGEVSSLEKKNLNLKLSLFYINYHVKIYDYLHMKL